MQRAVLLSFKRKRQMFKVVVAAWAIILVLVLSIITHSDNLTLSPELVFILIFVGMGLIAIAGVVLCRCPHCGMTLWYEFLPGVQMERTCPSCRLPLDES
jgi:hypothetical protein